MTVIGVQGIVRGLAEYVKIVEEIRFTHIRNRMIGIRPSIENDNPSYSPNLCLHSTFSNSV